MSSTRGGVALDIRVNADGAKEALESIGNTGQASLQRVADAASTASTATAAVTAEVAKIPDALAPAAAATGTLAERTRQLAAANQTNVVSLQAAIEVRQRNAVVMQAETAAINSQATAAQRLTSAVSGAAGTIGTLVDVGTQLAASSGSASSVLSTVAGFVGGYGPAGAAAAAALGLVAVAASRIEASSERAQAASQAAFESIQQGSRTAASAVDQVTEAFNNAARGAGVLAAAQREALAQTVQTQQRQMVALQESQQVQITEAERQVATLERRAAQDANERALARRAGGLVPQDQESAIQGQLFTATNNLAALRRELDATRERMAALNQAGQQLAENLPIPPIPPGAPERTHAAAAANNELTETTRQLADIERDRLALVARGQSTFEATRTEAEKYQERLGDLRNQLAAGAIDQDTFNRAVAAADPALRAAQKAADDSARQAQSAANSMENSFSSATTRWVDGAIEKGKSFFDSLTKGARNWALSEASKLVFRYALVPAANAASSAIGLGNLLSTPNGSSNGFSLAGIFGGSSTGSAVGQPVTNASGQLIGQVGNMSSAQTVMNGLRGFNPGDYMSGAQAFNTGWGGLDGVLNTPIGIGGSEAVGNLAATYGEGVALGNVANASGGAASTGMTIGSAGAAGLGIAGGLYGAYSGFERGGVGGYTQAAGGLATAGMSAYAAAMGTMSAIPVYGWIAAAVLAIVGSLLPGQKASGKGQETRVSLADGKVTRNGLTGDRYSAGNAEQSASAAQSIANLASELSSRLGGVQLDGDAAVGVTSSRGGGPGTLYLEISGQKAQFNNDEAGAKQLADKAAEFLLNNLRNAVTIGDYAGILRGSGTVDELQTNLNRYETEYKRFVDGVSTVNQYQAALDQVNATFQESIDWAQRMSLATDVVTAARQKELDKVTAQRDLQFSGFDQSLTIRALQANGGDAGPEMLKVALLQFDLAAKQQLETARTTLEGLGVASDDVTQRLAWNKEVLASERLKIQRDYNDQATAADKEARQQAASSALGVVVSLRDYLRGLSTSDASPGTVLDRFGAASQDFNAIFSAARAGDANSVAGLQGAAETYRSLAQQIYGGGQGYADAVSLIGERLGSVAGLGPEALTQSFERENRRENTDRIVDALAELRAENASLRRDINQLLTMPRAA